MKYYPVYVNIQNRKAVVIGGGRIAERKVQSLLRAGASVTVVSPELTPKLTKLKELCRICHIKACYRKKYISGAFIVIAATDSPLVNTKVSGDAENLVNIVDVPSLCNFIAPSVVQRGPLTISISTSGASPAFAKTLRSEIEGLYGPEIGKYLSLMKAIRKKAMGAVKEQPAREKFLKELASVRMLGLIRSKGFAAAKKEALARLAALSG